MKITKSGQVQAYEAKVCAHGSKIESWEGDWLLERLFILKFPSWDAAQVFEASSEYGQAR